MSTDPAAVLIRAEERLRARGLTGARAFEALLDAVRARLGDPVAPLDEAADAVSGLRPDGGHDLLGLAYERFFADLFKGRRGQYFTPRPLVEALLDLAGVGRGTTVLDPTCGSGGFLVCAARRGAVVQGIELDPGLVELARLNLRLAGLPGRIEHGDVFAACPVPVDVVVANPPFSVPVTDRAVLDRYELGRGRARVASDTLFLEAVESWVRPGGVAAVVLPWSILDNPTAEPLRQRLRDAWWVRRVVGLPEGLFRPFGGAAGRAVLLVMERGASGPTAWAEVTDPGWDVRSLRFKPTGGGDLSGLDREERWVTLPGGRWTPGPTTGSGTRVRDLAVPTDEVPRRVVDGPIALAELGDADRWTGELQPRSVEVATVRGRRVRLHPGEVLVARIRPELGTVTVVPPDADRLFGSPEWIALRTRWPHWLLHALRTPAWRSALPATRGQTRPRIHGSAVLDSRVRWPGERVAAQIDRLSRDLAAQRRALRVRLERLQALVDAHAAGELDDEALEAALGALEREEPS